MKGFCRLQIKLIRINLYPLHYSLFLHFSNSFLIESSRACLAWLYLQTLFHRCHIGIAFLPCESLCACLGSRLSQNSFHRLCICEVLFSVNPDMSFQSRQYGLLFFTDITIVWLLSFVEQHVSL